MAEQRRLSSALFSLINCMIRTLCNRLFKSSSNKQYLYLYPISVQYVRSYDKVNKTYVDIPISQIQFNDDSNHVYNTLIEAIPYHIFVKFAKYYRIDKDMHDYPVVSEYAHKKNYMNLLDQVIGEKYDFEIKLFSVMTSLYGKSDLLFLDNNKKEDYEKLFY